MAALHSQKKSSTQWYDFSGMMVYGGQKTRKNFRHNVKTMLYQKIVCANGYPCSKMVAQKSLMKKGKDTSPHPLQRETLNVSVRWFWVIDGWLQVKWRISHASAHEIIQDQLRFHKICERRFKNNSQQSTRAIVWQSAKAYSTAIVTMVMFF
jgi:hypothetical protein